MTDAAAIICLQGPHVLLIRSRKRPGSYEIPCGALLPGEDRFTGAIRELREETGLRVLEKHLVPIDHKPWGDHLVHIFVATQWTGDLAPGDDAEECFFGDPALLLKGAHGEDYATVMDAIAEAEQGAQQDERALEYGRLRIGELQKETDQLHAENARLRAVADVAHENMINSSYHLANQHGIEAQKKMIAALREAGYDDSDY